MYQSMFCPYHNSASGCSFDACSFSHEPTISRSPVKCKRVHPHGCPDQSLCAFIHEGEEWSVNMRPIIHPNHRCDYLEQELAHTKAALESALKEIERLKSAENEKAVALLLSDQDD